MMATGGVVVHFEFTECPSTVVDLRRSLMFNDSSERFKLLESKCGSGGQILMTGGEKRSSRAPKREGGQIFDKD